MNASSVTTRTRVIVFVDKNVNAGTPPTLGDLLQAGNTIAPRNEDTGDRFNVLMDKVYSQTAAANNVLTDEIYLKLSQHADWSGSASNTTEKGHIYLAYVSDQATLVPTLVYYSRLKYVDN